MEAVLMRVFLSCKTDNPPLFVRYFTYLVWTLFTIAVVILLIIEITGPDGRTMR